MRGQIKKSVHRVCECETMAYRSKSTGEELTRSISSKSLSEFQMIYLRANARLHFII